MFIFASIIYSMVYFEQNIFHNIQYSGLILAGSIAFLMGLADTLDALLAANKNVTFLHDVPELGFDIRSCFTFRPVVISNKVMDPCAVKKSDFVARTELHRAGVNQILLQRPEIKVIDLAQALCDDEWCFGSKNEVLFYMDDDHLSLRGADYVVRQLWDKF